VTFFRVKHQLIPLASEYTILKMLSIRQRAWFLFAVSSIVSCAREENKEIDLLEKKCPIDDDCLSRLKHFDSSSRDGRLFYKVNNRRIRSELSNEECQEVLNWCQSILAQVDNRTRADMGVNDVLSDHDPNGSESQRQLEPSIEASVIEMANNLPAITKDQENVKNAHSELEVDNDEAELEIDLDAAFVDFSAPPSKLQYMVAVISATLLVYATIFGVVRILQMLTRLIWKYSLMCFGFKHRKQEDEASATVEPPEAFKADKRNALASLKHRMRLDQEARALAKTKRATAIPAGESSEGLKRKVHLD